MNGYYSISKRVARTAIAVLASGLLIGGAAWRTIAADGQTTAHVATVTTPITHAVASGRDSYADVVDGVAPAVVTIHAEGKAKVSPKQRQYPGDGSYEDFLQTAAPINHGNSGGALVNTKGELVGINSQILSNSDGNIGIGFAIPANMAKNVMEQLRTKGKVTRAQLGVSVQNVTSDMAANLGLKHPGGVIVGSVTAGSAADRAGLKQGDVITALNGEAVHDFNSLRNRIASAGPGTNADLTIIRDDSERHVTVRLEELSADKLARRNGDSESDSPSDDKAALGVSVAPLTPDVASALGISKDANGLVVKDVVPDGRAADAGIQSGDVIEAVNRQPVRTVDDLRAAIRRTTDRPALLLINRKGSEIFVTVRPANG